jgi:hypothetical protein
VGGRHLAASLSHHSGRGFRKPPGGCLLRASWWFVDLNRQRKRGLTCFLRSTILRLANVPLRFPSLLFPSCSDPSVPPQDRAWLPSSGSKLAAVQGALGENPRELPFGIGYPPRKHTTTNVSKHRAIRRSKPSGYEYLKRYLWRTNGEETLRKISRANGAEPLIGVRVTSAPRQEYRRHGRPRRSGRFQHPRIRHSRCNRDTSSH